VEWACVLQKQTDGLPIHRRLQQKNTPNRSGKLSDLNPYRTLVHGATDGIKFKPSATKRPTRVPPDSLFLRIENCTDEAAKKVLTNASLQTQVEDQASGPGNPRRRGEGGGGAEERQDKKRYDDFHIVGVRNGQLTIQSSLGDLAEFNRSWM
jgi:hypothetical protein